jgi:hypothetical protein
MEDYVINLTEGGEFGVCAQTEHAENRTPGGLKQGYTLAFKSRVESGAFTYCSLGSFALSGPG